MWQDWSTDRRRKMVWDKKKPNKTFKPSAISTNIRLAPISIKRLTKHFNYGNIYHYIVESVTSFDSTELCSDTNSDAEIGQSSSDVHTSKPFTKGRNLFRSGHVKNMEDNQQKIHCFLKATVLASYSQKTKHHQLFTLRSTHQWKKIWRKKGLVEQTSLHLIPRPSNPRHTEISKDKKTALCLICGT